MRKRWLLVLAGMLWGTCSWAQSGDHVEIFGGYSYASNDFSGGKLFNQSDLTRGWNASLDLKFNRYSGFVSDFAGYFPPPLSANNGFCFRTLTSCSSSAHTYMFGPLFSFPHSNITPFVQVLLGFADASQNGTFSNFLRNKSFAFALGGGIDYYFTRHFALRAQADILHTHFTSDDSQDPYRYNTNPRLSGGLVVRF